MTSRVLLASQLGGGTGHLHIAAAVRSAVESLGVRCDVAVRDLAGAQHVAALAGARLLAAPDYRSPPRGLPPAACWAEALLAARFEAPDVVSGLVAGWLGLIDSLRPDRIVSEFCPAAILAGRIRGIPVRALGNGFGVPPPHTPMPTLQPWRELPRDRLMAAERRILTAFDAALRRFGAAPLEHLAELYPAAESRLLNFPELDHYGLRGPESCTGPVVAGTRGEVPDFPEGSGPRVLAYVHPRLGRFETVAAWLGQARCRTLLVAPGIDTKRQRRLTTKAVRIVSRQIDLEGTLPSADVTIMHGGDGSIATALSAGAPLVVVPDHVEQGLLAFRLAQQKLGVVVEARPDHVLPEPAALLERLQQSDHRAARKRFRTAHAMHDVAEARAALGRWILS